eukprot:TRINITY_DN11409_c0_g1_i1.p1 TRINITY_DN11409_c0_g1~~TRINITY_DN11409_c0_g1_i1.p1  ORF type:complete len:327 (+),score=32.78 TRINITY_DN11409_c0_g1_i1:169-1149(+)
MLRTYRTVVRYFSDFWGRSEPPTVVEECKFRIMEHIHELNLPSSVSKRDVDKIKVLFQKQCAVLANYDVVVAEFNIGDAVYRSLHFHNDRSTYNCTVQSLVNTHSQLHSIELEYLRGMMYSLPIAFVYNNNSFSDMTALVLGCGAGVLPSVLSTIQGIKQINTVEIEPEVVHCARKYFGYQDRANLKIITEDAIEYLKTCKMTYSLIVLDAYENSELPNSILSSFCEFLQSVRACLTDAGVVAGNIIYYDAAALETELKRWKSVFPNLTLLQINKNQMLVFASIIDLFDSDKKCQELVSQAIHSITTTDAVPLSASLVSDLRTVTK